MLKLIEFELILPPEEKINSSMASLFHGVLMETISKTSAASFHEEGLRPFSQCVYFDRTRNKSFWQIGTLTTAAYEQIIFPLLDKEKFFLRQKNRPFSLTAPKILLDTSYEKLADEIFPQKYSPRAVYLEFMTPTAFKHDGKYSIFPDIFLILNSLLQRWNNFSEVIKLDETNLAGKLAEFCRIVRYNLYTQTFSLERVNISGFCGRTNIFFGGNDMLNRILGLLFSFAPFAGVGIKTALGMGALKSEIFWRNKDDSIQSDRHD